MRTGRVRPWMVVLAVLALTGAAVGVVQVRRAGAATVHAQWVTVSAPSATSTYATVEAWQLQPDGRYKRMAHFPDARVGSAGVGAAREVCPAPRPGATRSASRSASSPTRA